MRLFVARLSPPSAAVQSTLAALKQPFTTVEMDYLKGEHLSEDHAQRNPQRELPVLEDDGMFLSESVAIMQYLCERYGADQESLYPRDPRRRAVVNHRLMYNMTSFYWCVVNHALGEAFGLDEDADKLREKALTALSVFETILLRQNTRFAAGEHVTIADISLASGTMCLESAEFNFSAYPTVARWYETFKKECPKLWEGLKPCMDDLHYYFINPPPKSTLAKLEELREKRN